MDHDKNAAVDGDSDLSFEALTFGDNGNHHESPEKNGARQIPKKKDKFRKKPAKKEGVSTPVNILAYILAVVFSHNI